MSREKSQKMQDLKNNFNDPIYQQFLAALDYVDKTGWYRKRVQFAKKAALTESTYSRIIRRKTKASYKTRVAIAFACGSTYEAFLNLGRKLMEERGEAPGQAGPAGPTPDHPPPDTPSNVVAFNGNAHHQIVEQFKNKQAACELNAALVEIEKLDPVAFGRIIGHVEATLSALKNRQPGTAGRGPQAAKEGTTGKAK